MDPKRDFGCQGPEFVSKALDQWAYPNRVTFDFSRLGKPKDTAYAELFNGRLGYQCLSVNWFLSLEDAQGKIEAWRRHYIESRPHTVLGDVLPIEFAHNPVPAHVLLPARWTPKEGGPETLLLDVPRPRVALRA